MTLANGVLFSGGAFDGQGLMLAMDATDGSILWSFNAQFGGENGGGIEASPAVVDGVVYWGTGASRGGLYSGDFLGPIIGLPGLLSGNEFRGNKMYAFELPGEN